MQPETYAFLGTYPLGIYRNYQGGQKDQRYVPLDLAFLRVVSGPLFNPPPHKFVEWSTTTRSGVLMNDNPASYHLPELTGGIDGYRPDVKVAPGGMVERTQACIGRRCRENEE